MSPSIILHQATKSILVAYSERELTFEVNLPTNLGELTFKNTSKWVIEQFRVGLVPESQGQNLVLTVLCVASSLDSGVGCAWLTFTLSCWIIYVREREIWGLRCAWLGRGTARQPALASLSSLLLYSRYRS